MSASEWVVLDGDGVFCRRCGEREKLFPAKIGGRRAEALQLIIESFQEEHAECELTDDSPEARQGLSPAHWLQGGDVGISSETICRLLGNLGEMRQPSWPRDPGDFGRCYRLLKHFSAWRSQLPEVAAKYPGTPWVPYVREWDRLTALYEEELPNGNAPKLWALMQQLAAEVPNASR